jgi:hypothetical protein
MSSFPCGTPNAPIVPHRRQGVHMLAYQIVAGFSEIKLELRKKAKISKKLMDLHLWFSLEGNTLRVHDYKDHKNSMDLAICKRKWIIGYKGVFGKRLIEYGIKSAENIKESERLNDLYKSHGFFSYFGL